MAEVMLPTEGNCSGCSACYNVCPVNAIDMVESNFGYLIPSINEEKCINCGLCSRTCPVLNPRYENSKTPEFYSFCASDEIRRNSSSGGMFTVLANYVLEKNGYVCGAAFDDEFQVKHIVIRTKEELYKLQYSKYVQSNIGNCYKDVKRLLSEDNYVLFTGTPCQIAGLYSVLGKDYDKLVTADLLCHGVPSQKLFNEYLKEISNGKKIKEIYFRNKKHGWTYVMDITFEDGTVYQKSAKGNDKDPYLYAFLQGYMSRYMCSDCKFNQYPRQGDFTIGDLWHSEELDPQSNDKKGTSFVFLNNEKAKNVFENIENTAKYCNRLHVEDYAKIPNRVGPKKKLHPNRKRFLAMIKNKTFSEALNYCEEKRYDIGLVGVMGNDNIGSVLTYYALYHALTDMGYSVLMIERPLDSPLPVTEKAKMFTDKWLPDYARPVQYKNIDEMHELNAMCEQFVVGSDQIYLASMSNARNDVYFLEWVDDYKNKIGYACSFGGPMARGSKEYYQRLRYYLNRFSFLSSRENDGVDLINNELKTDVKAKWCIDPVFLCDKEHYLKLVRATKILRNENFLGAYVVIPRPSITNLIRKTKEHFGMMPLELVGDQNKLNEFEPLKKYKARDSFPIGRILETIYSSTFFVTDSFHGVCFAIIFKKDFLVVPRDFTDRFHSLLDRIGLDERIIKADMSNLTEESFKPIDYEAVYSKLDVLIDECRKDLSYALKYKREPIPVLTNMDVVRALISKQQKEIEQLKSALENKTEADLSYTKDVDLDIISRLSDEEIRTLIVRLLKENRELKQR